MVLPMCMSRSFSGRCLYLTGRSNTFRTILSVGVFLVTLVSGAGLFTACVAAVLGQIAGVVLFDIVVLRELNQVDYGWSAKQGVSLTASAILLFVSVFLDFYIFSAAKYAIDAHLGDAASGYFNVIFMPTSVINLAAGFVIRPFLTYLTDCWNEHRFSDFKKLLTIMAVIGGLTVLAAGGTVVLGKPVLALLEWLLGASYSGTLTALWPAFIMIVLGGGFLRGVKSLLLRAGHSAQAEADLWHLRGTHGACGYSGTEAYNRAWNIRRGPGLPHLNDRDGSGLRWRSVD